MVGGLRRCRRRSCQDGFRQPHRRRGGDGRGGTLRIRLWFDPCRERRRTDPSCGRAAGYDRSRRGVDRQRRENAARRPLQGQYREIRGRLPRQGGEPCRGDDLGARTPDFRLSGRSRRTSAGLYPRVPGHQLRLRHGQGIPQGRGRGRNERVVQPRGRRHPAFDPRNEGTYPPRPYLRTERRLLVGRRTRRQRQVHRQRAQQ